MFVHTSHRAWSLFAFPARPPTVTTARPRRTRGSVPAAPSSRHSCPRSTRRQATRKFPAYPMYSRHGSNTVQTSSINGRITSKSSYAPIVLTNVDTTVATHHAAEKSTWFESSICRVTSDATARCNIRAGVGGGLFPSSMPRPGASACIAAPLNVKIDLPAPSAVGQRIVAAS